MPGHSFPFSRIILASTACAVLVGASHAEKTDPAALKFFETKIRPLLTEQCIKCHGEKKHKANLRLDNLPFILQGGDGGPALVQGDVGGSLIMKAVSYEDADLQMPPDNKLEPQQIADLKKWIELGAPWPENEAKTADVRKPGEFTEKERAWWAIQPVKKVTPPDVSAAHAQIKNPIDQFIVAKLQGEGLKQNAPADRAEFARRIYLDMHGIAPTPEELAQFTEDNDPHAVEKLVEKLLESPRYGERWAQHWLDLVRYGESDGYRQDAYRPDAWRYRDYVIRSLNSDKPYDRFVKEQLAGDEMNADDPDTLIGTAFLRQTAYEYNQRDAEGQRKTILNEITDVTGEVFLGVSFGCAQCHDHKFDPILQKDYYRLQAFFAPMIWRDDIPFATPEQKREHDEKMARWNEATAEVRKQFEPAVNAQMEKLMHGAVKKFPDEVQAMVLKPEEEKSPYEKEVSYFVKRQGIEEQSKFLTGKTKGHDKTLADNMHHQLKAFDHLKPAPLPVAFVVTDVAREAPPVTVKTRREGELTLLPGYPTILSPMDAAIPVMPESMASTGRRTALASWITREDNPLTARVIVNRIWQYHFGRGIVGTASDFGKLGEKPSHPELLDWLADQFMANGWSFKWLHRMILNSATYAQSARIAPGHPALKKDPENRWLWRNNPLRLDAEEARDTLLAVSGELQPSEPGPGMETTRPVRAVYTRKIRNSQDDFMRSFDAPNGFQSVARREATNTALQSLLMINGDWPLQRARALASRLLKETGPLPGKLIPRAYELVYSRPPTPAEMTAATAFIASQTGLQKNERKTPKAVPLPPDPLVDAQPFFGRHPLGGARTVAFKPGGAFEKLRVQTDEAEGDSFTVEAVIYLDSLYQDAAVRTIASRWNNDKASKGWAFGVTSTASKYQPNNLIVQLCGDDFQASTIYEVVASNIRIPLKTPYYVAAVISNQPAPDHETGGTVTFYAKNLADPMAILEQITVPHPVVGGYSNPERQIYIGGRDHDPRSLWDGLVSRVTIARGTLGEDSLLVTKPEGSGGCVFDAQADSISSTSTPKYFWEKASTRAAVNSDSSELDVITDFCHVLINSNEFLYLQ